MICPSFGRICLAASGLLVVAWLTVGQGSYPGMSDEAGGASKRAAEAKAATDWPTAPRYTEKGELKFPGGYENWVFVGSNLGIEYREKAADAPAGKAIKNPAVPENFHNVSINPEAYEHYRRTGEFPENTVLVLDIYKAESGEPNGIVAQGRFPGKQVSVAVAVKNSARPDGGKSDWAYYDFAPGASVARAFPDRACYACHLEHAGVDNVWVQFYPTLRKLRATMDKPASRAAE